MMIWLLASRHQNRLPDDPQWIERRINATEKVSVDALISSGFLEYCTDDSNSLERLANGASLEEEKETEKKHMRPAGANGHVAAERQPRTETPEGVTLQSVEAQPPPEPIGFQTWWKEYPSVGTRKRGRAKCLRIWRRMKLEPIASHVLGALRRCKASQDWLKQGGQYIPGPEPWLNDTPWETEELLTGRVAPVAVERSWGGE
jgi:hypothetical protein